MAVTGLAISTAGVTGGTLSWRQRQRGRAAFDLAIRHAIPISFIVQLGLIGFGEFQDRHSDVKYTDVDYRVFSDAVKCLWTGCSRGDLGTAGGIINTWLGGIIGDPYARATYRYTPLLAVVMSPIWLLKDPLGAFFGKIVFSAMSSFVVAPLLMQSPINASPTMVHLIWTLNPMILNINTRGSSESLLIAMVMGSLVTLKRRHLGWAAALWALSVHWKVYPIVYGASILVELHKMDRGRLFTRTKMDFALTSAGTFLALSALCWAIWGGPFLQHTYLYHIGRLDHRHNFSAYFYPIYQAMFARAVTGRPTVMDSISRISRHPVFAFVPQMVVTIVSGFILSWRYDQEFAWFIQTVVFVTFNKVCTSQYFLWYLFFLPIILPRLNISRTLGLTLLAAWIGGQAIWLSIAYSLEFLADNVYIRLWSAGLLFTLINTWGIVTMIRTYQRPTP